MMLLSLVVCLAMVKFYDWSKRDWLGISAVEWLWRMVTGGVIYCGR
jgi:hypothetical protein